MDENLLTGSEEEKILKALDYVSKRPKSVQQFFDTVAVDGIYETEPVSIEQFVRDEYYLGKSVANLHPNWVQELKTVFDRNNQKLIWIMCLAGETVVPLLDGTYLTIKELWERWQVDPTPFKVYSSTNSGLMVPGTVVKVSKYPATAIYRAILNDNSFFRATGDHEMLMSWGLKVQLLDIKESQRLMAYVRIPKLDVDMLDLPGKEYTDRTIVDISPDGFEEVYCLTVPEWGNFAIHTGEGGGVISGNTGAIGTGKTTSSAVAIVYLVYQLSCMKDPQAYFGLLPDAKIIFGIFNVTLDKGEVGYDKIMYYIDNSPYFQNDFKRSIPPKNEIVFPQKRIEVVVGSLSTHALGENIYGFVLDEANFFKGSPDPAARTRAHQIFTEAQTRLTSRFMQAGGVKPGLICLISSRKFHTSFLEEQEKLATGGGIAAEQRHVTSFALWDVKPTDKYSGKKFGVVIGDERKDPYILEEDENPPPGYEVVMFPEEFRADAETDASLALRDIAGVATHGVASFIPKVEIVEGAFRMAEEIEPLYRSPFDVEMITDVGVKTGKSITEHIDERRLFKIAHSTWSPILAPGIARVAHIDLGANNDRAAIAIGYPRMMQGGVGVFFDFIISCCGPLGDEVDFSAIIGLFKWLRGHGMQIAMISYDSWQSRHSIQELTKAGFNAVVFSPKLEHYKLARTLLAHRCCAVPRNSIWSNEMCALVRDPDDVKPPDHPPNGHDDTVAAWVAVCNHCCQENVYAAYSQNDRGEQIASPVVYIGSGGRQNDGEYILPLPGLTSTYRR